MMLGSFLTIPCFYRVQGWCHGYVALISASSLPLELATCLASDIGVKSTSSVKIVTYFPFSLQCAGSCIWMWLVEHFWPLWRACTSGRGTSQAHTSHTHTGESSKHILMIRLYAFSQRVPANVKDLILCDVTGKGVIELVVSLTDRVVRTYRCKLSEFKPPNWQTILSIKMKEVARPIFSLTWCKLSATDPFSKENVSC